MEVTFTWKDIRGEKSTLDQVAPLPGMEKAVLRALKKAGRDMLRSIRTASSRTIRFRKRISVKRVNDGLPTKTSGGSLEDLEWRMDVSGAPIPVVEYPHRQTSRGVRVTINAGRSVLISSAFVATMRSGHTGVFERRGSSRLPIDELYSSRLSDVMNDSGAVEAVTAVGFRSFNETWDRVFPLELEKTTG